jgi:hypothetical protein
MMSERHLELLSALLPTTGGLQSKDLANIVLSYCEPSLPIGQWERRGDHAARISKACDQLYPTNLDRAFPTLIFLHTDVPFEDAFKSHIASFGTLVLHQIHSQLSSNETQEWWWSQWSQRLRSCQLPYESGTYFVLLIDRLLIFRN